MGTNTLTMIVIEFQMPQNRSFDVFILEDGTEYQLVTQNFLKLQPTLAVSSDTVVTLSMAVLKISDDTCEDVSARDLSNCIIAKIQERVPSLGISCLPYQFHSLFLGLQQEYSLCTNETVATGAVFRVS